MTPFFYIDFIKKIISQQDTLYFINLIWLWLTAMIILFSVIIKFMEYGVRPDSNENTKPHIVETFSMAVVIIIIFNIMQANIGVIRAGLLTRIVSSSFGIILSAAGCYMHVWSKVAIGKYWSNMIEIQKGHRIITTGPYSIVRHPMYSSLILWLSGESIMFLNWASVLATIAIFLPMMMVRAEAEDILLEKADPTGFSIHGRDAKQLLPRFGGWFSTMLRLAAISVFVVGVVIGKMDIVMAGVVVVTHAITGLLMKVPKVAFSYINKSVMILMVFFLSLVLPQAKWLYYIIIIFDIWGLFSNCPCMIIYEKYNGCPCLDFLKSYAVKK